MKIRCKRTYFETNPGPYNINGRGYGEKYAKWKWGKIYEAKFTAEQLPNLYSEFFYLDVKNDDDDVCHRLAVSLGAEIWTPITRKEFDKYFEMIEDYRENTIKKILE